MEMVFLYQDHTFQLQTQYNLRVGSLLLQNGAADLFTVSKLLGHSSVNTTEKYYVDLLDENFYNSVRKLTEII